MRLYVALAMFVLVLNLFFFFAHPDLTICFLSIVGHLKTFRAVGLLGMDNLPAIAKDFYSKLALVTLDFQFGKPGCDGTSADFVSYVFANTAVLAASIGPTVVIMPLLIALNMCLRSIASNAKPKPYPATKESDDDMAADAGHVRMSRWWTEWTSSACASRRLTFWKDRFSFCCLMWCKFATFIMTSLSLQAIVCRKLEGQTEYTLVADRTFTCGSSTQMWTVHLSGAAAFVVLAILYPGMIEHRVHSHKRQDVKGGLDNERTLSKYGHFYTDYKRHDWRVFFFGIQHWLENISFAMFAAFMTDYDSTTRNIAIGAFIGAYVLLLLIVQPFAERKTMVCAQIMNAINLYAIVLSEVMSRIENVGEYAIVFTVASVLIIAIMIWFVWYFDIIACGWLVEHCFAPLRSFSIRLLRAAAVKIGMPTDVAGPALASEIEPECVEHLSPVPPACAPDCPGAIIKNEIPDSTIWRWSGIEPDHYLPDSTQLELALAAQHGGSYTLVWL
jgi:hypothetical protein